MTPRDADLDRIRRALTAAERVLRPFTPGEVAHRTKTLREDPVTEADLAVDRVLRESLPVEGEGWLSEETADDPARLDCRRVWVVDPLDGTREFVEGIPEWCVSVGLVEEGRAVAGGIFNPATGERIVGSVETGLVEGATPRGSVRGLRDSRVLASRSEVRRGEWERWEGAPFEVVPCGSVAYKLARVAAGSAEATWTLVPKNEWDVAGGVALIRAAGLHALHTDGSEPRFNRSSTLLPNLIAGPRPMIDEFLDLLHRSPAD